MKPKVTRSTSIKCFICFMCVLFISACDLAVPSGNNSDCDFVLAVVPVCNSGAQG